MAHVLETINRFKVRCEACQHFYQAVAIGGLKKLLHAKVDPDHLDTATLPTKKCRLQLDYVRFKPCGHCCPEVFELCPEPHTESPGKPTTDACSG